MMGFKEDIVNQALNSEFQLTKKELTIIEILENYGKSLDIIDLDEQAYTGFDQNGKFCGWWGAENVFEKGYELLKNVILPPYLRERESEEGSLHLLTSYISLEDQKATNLEYKSVAGSIKLKRTRGFYALELESVGECIMMEHCKEFSSPNLQSIGGHFSLKSIIELDLPNLESIQGSLNIYRTERLNCPKLKNIEGLKVDQLPNKKIKEILKNLNNESIELINKESYYGELRRIVTMEWEKRKVKRAISVKGGFSELEALDL